MGYTLRPARPSLRINYTGVNEKSLLLTTTESLGLHGSMSQLKARFRIPLESWIGI